MDSSFSLSDFCEAPTIALHWVVTYNDLGDAMGSFFHLRYDLFLLGCAWSEGDDVRVQRADGQSG